jgi:hypothetical protein
VNAPLLVHRARVAGSAATRGAVERWLSRVPVESLGLAEDELFYVPRLSLRVPREGGLAGAVVADRILAALRQLLASAESGWDRGFTPDRPYRFTSRGRYFAWLIALRLRDGSVAAREAFRAATGHDALAPWQRAVVLREAAPFVATVARLAEIGCAARWIAGFEPADFALAYRALDEGFGVRLAAPAEPPARPLPARRATAPAERARFAAAVAALVARGNDWHRLTLPGRTLLLAAAVLARSSSRPPGPTALAEAVAALALPPPLPQPAPAQPLPVAVAGPVLRRPASAPAAGEVPARRPVPPGTAATTVRPLPSAASPGDRAAPEFGTSAAPAHVGRRIAPPAPSVAPVARAAPTPALPPPLLAADTGFTTGYGGLLFLVNAFVALGLYPDFTRPRGARLEPSPLWLADRIGRYWFGAGYRRDPLAAWIAAHGAPGRLPDSWRVPRDWLAGFDRGRPARMVGPRRVTLWHPAGFPLADTRVARSRAAPSLRRARRRLPAARADRWAACLALYLDARLRRFARGGLSLLALSARVEVRELDLRATFALDHYPVALRLAGLDRDPGWQPAEGRAIAFAFA